MRFFRLMAFILDLSISHFLYALWSSMFVRGLLASVPPEEQIRFLRDAFHPFLSEPIFMFCYFWFLTSLWSDTPGMVLLGLKVIRDTDQRKPLGFLWSFSRVFFLFLTLLPLGMGALLSFLSPSGKTLYDCLSQSRVIGTGEENPQIT